MAAVMSNLLEVLNFHSNQYSLIKQGNTFFLFEFFYKINIKFIVLTSTKFMELFLSDDHYICPLMINTFEDIVRKSR